MWYRAPEIILGSEDYFLGVDIWSVGCIFAELFGKRPVFMCKNEVEVLQKVFYMLGTPSASNCSQFKKLPKYDKLTASLTDYRNGHIRQMYSEAPTEALDLLTKMLCLDPSKRILAKEALAHPFLNPSCAPTGANKQLGFRQYRA